MKQISSNFNGLEFSRAVFQDFDFKSMNGCGTTILEDKSSKSINNHPEAHGLAGCRVVLKDVLVDGSTAKYKMLNSNLNETHN